MKPVRFRVATLALLTTYALLLTASNAYALPDSLRVVVLGSSTAAGAGPSTPDSAWVWRYSAYLTALNPSYEVINLARGGYTSYHLQPTGYIAPEGRPEADTLRNLSYALSYSPDAIILNLPSNDAARDYSIEEQIANFERMVTEARSAGVAVWVTTTQPRNMSDARRQNLVTMRDWILGAYGHHAIDFWSGIAEADGRILPWANSGDGIHLTDAAHALLAERVRGAGIPEAFIAITSMATPHTPAPEVRVWPQPARDQVHMSISAVNEGRFTLYIYDIHGRRVRDVHRGMAGAHAAQISFSMSRFPAGMYNWVLISAGRVSSGRFVVVH
jgi:lysophospholipase L1-like esterase